MNNSDFEPAAKAILDRIVELAPNAGPEQVRQLGEAYADVHAGKPSGRAASF